MEQGKNLYSVINVVLDSVMVVLKEVDPAVEVSQLYSDPNICHVVVSKNSQQVSMKCLQLIKWVVFNFQSCKQQPTHLKINSASFIKPQLSNYYIRPKTVKDLTNLLKDQTMVERLTEIVRTNILGAFDEPLSKPIHFLKSPDVAYHILKFLNEKDSLSFLAINKTMAEQSRDRSFWFTLYSKSYGRTGFKEGQLDWKKVYCKKKANES